MHITFVLLSHAAPLAAAHISASYAELFPGETLTVDGSEVLRLITSDGCEADATLALGPITTGEVEAAAQGSASVFSGVTADTTHAAHVIVATATSGSSKSAGLAQHSKVVAAVAKAQAAHAIYDARARATFPSEFFFDLIRDALFVPLWTGIRFAPEGAERGAFVTLGLDRFDLPDLLVSAPHSRLDFAYELLLDIVKYVVKRGEAIAHGDTIGRSPLEAFRVTHERSPVREGATVMRIDLGDDKSAPLPS